MAVAILGCPVKLTGNRSIVRLKVVPLNIGEEAIFDDAS
jgi:hypothetical protein